MLDKVANLALIRPALPCRYEVLIEGLSPLLIAGGTFPHNTMESFTKKDGNSVKYFPGSYDVDDVELEIVETDGADAMNFFYNWRASLYCGVSNQADYYNLPDAYKKSLRIYRLSADQRRVDGWQYVGAWPKSVAAFSPDASSNSEVLKFSVTLSVDGIARLDSLT